MTIHIINTIIFCERQLSNSKKYVNNSDSNRIILASMKQRGTECNQ